MQLPVAQHTDYGNVTGCLCNRVNDSVSIVYKLANIFRIILGDHGAHSGELSQNLCLVEVSVYQRLRKCWGYLCIEPVYALQII